MFDTLAGFLDMGGYGAFIWSAWGMAVLILGGITFASRRRLGAARRAGKAGDDG